MEIKQINYSDIHANMLRDFNRYQEAAQCWRKDVDHNQVLEDVSFIRDWSDDKKKWAIACFEQCIARGGVLIGAFDGIKLIGFAQMDGELFGSSQQYINLSLLLISKEYRHKGLGRLLFKNACNLATRLHAKKLYISAYSAKDTIDFYKKMGCRDAQEIFLELMDDQYDLQLEYELNQNQSTI